MTEAVPADVLNTGWYLSTWLSSVSTERYQTSFRAPTAADAAAADPVKEKVNTSVTCCYCWTLTTSHDISKVLCFKLKSFSALI